MDSDLLAEDQLIDVAVLDLPVMEPPDGLL